MIVAYFLGSDAETPEILGRRGILADFPTNFSPETVEIIIGRPQSAVPGEH